MNKEIQNNGHFNSIEQLVEYLQKCSNKLIIRISMETQTNQSIKKIEDGIEISSLFIELWDHIKNFISTTIYSLEIPFSFIEKDSGYSFETFAADRCNLPTGMLY